MNADTKIALLHDSLPRHRGDYESTSVCGWDGSCEAVLLLNQSFSRTYRNSMLYTSQAFQHP